MRTVEGIRTSIVENKYASYIDLARSYATMAADTTGGFMVTKIKEEIVLCFRKCESADCEYAAYAAAHACEIWFNKLSK